MRISFELQEDAELRQAIREMVKAEAKGMIREGIKEAIDEELDKLAGVALGRFDTQRAVNEEMRKVIREKVIKAVDDNVPSLHSEASTKRVVKEILTDLLASWVSTKQIDLRRKEG